MKAAIRDLRAALGCAVTALSTGIDGKCERAGSYLQKLNVFRLRFTGTVLESY
jgi:hypothetical protein